MLVRQSCAVSGVTGIALTKLDVLDGFEEMQDLLGYDLDGERIDHLPAAAADQARVEADLRDDAKAGARSTAGARSWADLPAAGDQICPPRSRN